MFGIAVIGGLKDEIKFVITNLQYSKKPISPYSKEIHFLLLKLSHVLGEIIFTAKFRVIKLYLRE